MPTINFMLADGAEHAIDGEIGTPVMYLAKRNELPGILAECGGQCRCATCHVHIDPRWAAKLPKMKDDERETLEFADGVDDLSRLSCQIKITDEMDGLIVHVPQSQYGADSEPEPKPKPEPS
ncbi:2Fe-2S iron-sulfur cluster-binding protein [Candidatus Spongiihabitans sp.]|uniref:2Fe-2S iron-sulfur cluster-binding protein n=1 Tax=Candidatus Spongiihabitans sp. TaxID=3101308 RepID=UPI003C7E0E75